MVLSFSGHAALAIAGGLTVLVLLALDLGWFQRVPREPTFRESLAWTAIWIALAVVFGTGVTLSLGTERGVAFFSTYLVEQSLSVDNLLVLIVIFAQLAIPRTAQRKALVAGVLGAFALRTVLILGGASLIARVHAMTYVLGALLLVAAYKLARSDGAEPAAGRSLVARVARRILPVARDFDGARFFTREAGALRVTPLLVAVLVIEVTDLVFALDSIPAVLGITPDPFVALTSNLFAVLGLRSLFFVVSGLLARLRHLKTGLVLVLGFVAGKLLAAPWFEVPIVWDLAVIATILGGAVVASLRTSNPQPQPQEDP